MADENHSVVKNALTGFESIINLLIPLFGVKAENNLMTEKNLLEEMLDKLLLGFYNKYWLVQCKYCDVITKLDYQLLFSLLEEEKSNFYQVIFKQYLISIDF